MVARILPKSLPKYILKKANSLNDDRLSKHVGKEPHERHLSDEELHGMLQDLLDAEGWRAWSAEFNLIVHHDVLAKDVKEAKDKVLKVVKFPKRRRRN